ncbi:hypothetical protein JQR85_13745 [Stutzerimonas urumqiensis]|uniref:hypothetical protein n=1 Tax=Stutzerimonas urumqiensis TaxID=638269 RepID=UPI003DA21F2F
MSKVRIECWKCHADVLLIDRSDADGECPRCGVEIALDDYLIQAMDARDALAAENERLRKDRAACWAEFKALVKSSNDTGRYLHDEIERLTARVAELERDAGRYRWLRGRLPGSAYRIAGVIYSEGGDGVDAAVDAAMAAQAEKESTHE